MTTIMTSLARSTLFGVAKIMRILVEVMKDVTELTTVPWNGRSGAGGSGSESGCRRSSSGGERSG